MSENKNIVRNAGRISGGAIAGVAGLVMVDRCDGTGTICRAKIQALWNKYITKTARLDWAPSEQEIASFTG